MPPILELRQTQNLGERLISAKLTLNQDSNISLTPKLSNIEDAISQTGTCPMSATLKDLLPLLDGNQMLILYLMNMIKGTYFHDTTLVHTQEKLFIANLP